MLKKQLGSCVTFFPQPATLVASTDKDGIVNLMMASWVGIVSKTPPTIAVSLNKERKTYANILETGEFTVNVVSADMAIAADACGLASGFKTDKQQLTGMSLSRGVLSQPLLVDASPLNVECCFTQEVVLGDYRLVMGKILEIHAIERAYDDNGHADIKAFDPLVYLGGLREYWSLGNKAADAYSAGLDLLKESGTS